MKNNAQFIIIGIWGALGSGINRTIERWSSATPPKMALMIGLNLLLVGVSLDLVRRYKPDNLLNPYLAGPKTKALFMSKPLLAGFVSMTMFVAVMVAVMRVLA